MKCYEERQWQQPSFYCFGIQDHFSHKPRERVFIKLTGTRIHTIKNVLGTRDLFLNTTTWTNVHILNGYSEPVSLSAYVCDCADMESPTWYPHVVQPFRSPSLLLLSRVARALITCAVRNVAALFPPSFLQHLPGFTWGHLTSSGFLSQTFCTG